MVKRYIGVRGPFTVTNGNREKEHKVSDPSKRIHLASTSSFDSDKQVLITPTALEKIHKGGLLACAANSLSPDQIHSVGAKYFTAAIRIFGKAIDLGRFRDEVTAAKAYDRAAIDRRNFALYKMEKNRELAFNKAILHPFLNFEQENGCYMYVLTQAGRGTNNIYSNSSVVDGVGVCGGGRKKKRVQIAGVRRFDRKYNADKFKEKAEGVYIHSEELESGTEFGYSSSGGTSNDEEYDEAIPFNGQIVATSEDATELLLKNNLNFSFKDVTRLDSNDLQSKIQIQAKNSQRQIQGHTNSNNYCKSTSTNNKQSAPSSPKITLEIPLQTCSDVVSMFEPLFGDDAKGGDQESQPTTNENETDDEDNEAIESWVDDGKNIGRDSFFEKIKDNVDVDAIISDEPNSSGGQSPILDKVFADEVDNEEAFDESVADAEMLQKLLFMPIELPDGGAGAQLSSGCSIVSGEMMLSSPSSVLLFDQRVEPFPTTRRRELKNMEVHKKNRNNNNNININNYN